MNGKLPDAVCHHVPIDDGKPWYVGKTTVCKLCGAKIVYNNKPAGSRVRMSKKERRLMRKENKNVN